MNEIFGGARKRGSNGRTVVQGESDERVIDFVEDGKNIFIVFELPGFRKKDVMVAVKGLELEVHAKRQNPDGVQPYLMQKLGGGVSIKKTLPKFVNSKKFDYTMVNGVLEIKFEKSGGKK